MWQYWYFEHEGIEYHCEGKVYDNPSTFGVNGGRISKLYVHNCETSEMVYLYERGESINKLPSGALEKAVREWDS